MTKTTPLTNDAHKRLKEIQEALRDRYDISMTLKDVMARIIPERDDAIKTIIDSIKKVSNDIAITGPRFRRKLSSLKHHNIETLEQKDVKDE